MAQKAKRSLPAVDPHASYAGKARYDERYSTPELLAAGHLEEGGVCQYLRKTATWSLGVDKALLAQLKQVAKELPLRPLIRRWRVKHTQEEQAA